MAADSDINDSGSGEDDASFTASSALIATLPLSDPASRKRKATSEPQRLSTHQSTRPRPVPSKNLQRYKQSLAAATSQEISRTPFNFSVSDSEEE